MAGSLGSVPSDTPVAGGVCRKIQRETPTNGSTIDVDSGPNVLLIIVPDEALPKLTVAMNPTPNDGDEVTIASTHVVAAVTVSNGAVSGASLAALRSGTSLRYLFSAVDGMWLQLQ